MATFNDSSKEKITKWHAKREANIYIYIYIGTITTTTKKRNNKQETDYNKILVGARTRDRKKTKEEMIINSRLNGSNLVFVFFLNLISKYTIQSLLFNTNHD
jgi:predicted membrane-bound mannosyltransferase